MSTTRRDSRWWAARKRKDAILLLFLGCMLLAWFRTEYLKYPVIREIERLNGRATSKYFLGFGTGFGPLERVRLEGASVDDESLQVLEDVPELRDLTLANTQVTDEGLARLRQFRKLVSLAITDDGNTSPQAVGPRFDPSGITGKGLEQLKDLPSLRTIQFTNVQITDKDLKAIEQLKGLTQVDLVSARVTADGITRLRRALPNCRVVSR